MTETMQRFLEEAGKDEALVEKINSAESADTIVTLAKELGFELKDEDLVLGAACGEISDDDIDAVVGGAAVNNSMVSGSMVKNSIVSNSMVNNSMVKNSMTSGSMVKDSMTSDSMTSGSIVNNSMVNGSMVNSSMVNGSMFNWGAFAKLLGSKKS